MAGRTPLSTADYLFNEARHAVHDIRQKLFEEAWFGRVVTAEPVMEVFKGRDASTSTRDFFEEAWGRGRRPEHEQERPQHEQEIDR
jgi:hypothetical protein